MPLCSTACAQDPVPYGSGGCRVITRPGGIYKFLWLRCDIAAPAATVLAFQGLLDSGDIVASGKVLASKTKGTTTKQRVTSCDPERAIQRTSQIPWKDYNADNVTFSEFAFWNDKMSNQDRLLFGYTTCDELFYGWFDSYSLELDNEQPETNNEAACIAGTFEVNGLSSVTPVKIVGLNAILQTSGS